MKESTSFSFADEFVFLLPFQCLCNVPNLEALETRAAWGWGAGGWFLLVISSEDGCQDVLRGQPNLSDGGLKKMKKQKEKNYSTGVLTLDFSGEALKLCVRDS